MTGKCLRLVCWVVCGLAAASGGVLQSASAQETPNVLMGIDGMTVGHAGLFRSNTGAAGADGFNTFVFNASNAAGSLGRYKSFYFVEQEPATNGGISHNARMRTDTPNSWDAGSSSYVVAEVPDINSNYFPTIDRAGFGQLFNPADYVIEMKFKPLSTSSPAPFNSLPNEAHGFGVTLDLLGGFVWDVEQGRYKRSGEQVGYTFNTAVGDPDITINDWYATAPKDANGFATLTWQVDQPTFSQRAWYFNFGNSTFRQNNVVSSGGRELDPDDDIYVDVNHAFGENYSQFGGGPSDPARPGSKFDTPNGVAAIGMGSASEGDDVARRLSMEVLHIALKKANPGNLVSRIDVNSSITFRFGSGFTRGSAATPINIDGFPFVPEATDQISRFDANGMLSYLDLNMRTPDNPETETHRFLVRGAPNIESFDGTQAMVNVRARLSEPLGAGIANTLTIVAKDLDGNDTVANPVGADEYTYNLDLSQFNTSTFTTVSIPLSNFVLSTHVPTTASVAGSGPFGFLNPGDGLLTDFHLYEFGGLLAPNSGVLRLDLEFMEIRLPSLGIPGDYNGDGLVDAADYTIWRNNLGQDASALADGSRDPANMGPINGDDYTFWKNNYGGGAGSGGLALNVAVPEPTSFVLLAGLLCGIAAAFPRSVR